VKNREYPLSRTGPSGVGRVRLGEPEDGDYLDITALNSDIALEFSISVLLQLHIASSSLPEYFSDHARSQRYWSDPCCGPGLAK
jgi:hypothetical protein